MPSSPRNRELEAAIVAAPDSHDTFLVYGDWLIEQGEALGELVSVQAALEKETLSATLSQREAELLAENEGVWLGHFARYAHRWRFGFLESIRLTEPGREDVIDLLDLLASRFLRELDIELLGHRSFENSEVIGAIVEVGLPPLLRKLTLSPTGDCGAVDIGSIRALWPRLAAVEDLTIRAGNMLTGDIALPRATKVSLATHPNEQTANIADAIARASWPRLTDLSIDLCDPFYGYRRNPWIGEGFFTPILAALAERREAGHSLLRRLALVGHIHGDVAAAALATSPVLATLEELDLSSSGMSLEGARLIALQAGRFAHLKRLVLERNRIPAEGEALLRGAFGERVSTHQQIQAEQTYGPEAEDWDGDDVDS